jgi:RHS repeat-associated protein
MRRYYDEGELADGAKLYYAQDHLGSVRDVVDANSHTLAAYDYDPYGLPTRTTGTSHTDFRYAGLLMHYPSGLYLANYRAYDPASGRWISRDPIGEEGGVNLYAYVLGNPIGYTDPLGLSPYNDPMNQIANRAAGLPPNANLPPPIKGTVTANAQLGNIGPIPVGVTFQCTIDNNGMKPSYLGAGIVIGRSLRYGATATVKNGDPSGYGVRTNISVPVVKGGGISASSVVTSTGSVTSVGVQTVGAGASGSATYGYSFK